MTVLDDYLTCHGLYLQSSPHAEGKSVLSSRHHERGSVLVTSQPLGTVVLPSSRHQVCNYCFHKPPPLHSLQRCSQCQAAYFCDVACFKNAWLTYHQYTCRPQKQQEGKQQLGEQEVLDLELLERISLNCWRYKRTLQHNQRSNDKEEEGVDVTMTAFDSLTATPLSSSTRLAHYALSRRYLISSGLTIDQLTGYWATCQRNTMDILDDHLFPVGRGIYPVASLINHSCRPNAVIVYEDALASIIAIEPIAPHQEITIDYVDPAYDYHHRQSSLMDRYSFTCQCHRCLGDGMYHQIDTLLLGNQAMDQEKALALLRRGIPTTTKMNNTNELLRATLLQQVNEWDLLEMCRLYDRRHDGMPPPHQPLTLATYTHFVIQYFAPYLWSTDRSYYQRRQRHGRAALSYFDDPRPKHAQPRVPPTYQAILHHVLTLLQSYPTTTEIIPWRLEWLASAAHLLYDEMNRGHWRNAVKLAMYVLIQFCWIYPPYHPLIAQHLLLLAKCSWNSLIKSQLVGQGKALEVAYERGVRRWILLAKETLAHAVGKKGEQWREVIELEWIFLREQKLKE
ncbi:hypothetical protein BC941DRAFT_441784 [Chlamydoabsidia padenii]|nr:hypothetical protein BC941DRAFT_441784 [Chlamydoabsidia padenii]